MGLQLQAARCPPGLRHSFRGDSASEVGLSTLLLLPLAAVAGAHDEVPRDLFQGNIMREEPIVTGVL